MFALVLLSIIRNSLDYVQSRNKQGKKTYTKKRKKIAICVALLHLL